MEIIKGGNFMYYGGYGAQAGAGAAGYGYGAGYGCCEPVTCCPRGGGFGYAFILVLFILLVIIGCTCCPGYHC